MRLQKLEKGRKKERKRKLKSPMEQFVKGFDVAFNSSVRATLNLLTVLPAVVYSQVFVSVQIDVLC